VGCGAPPGTFNENCARIAPTFYGEVDRVIEELLADRFLRRENGSYRSTCRPAWF
jgi:hypothetical protein